MSDDADWLDELADAIDDGEVNDESGYLVRAIAKRLRALEQVASWAREHYPEAQERTDCRHFGLWPEKPKPCPHDGEPCLCCRWCESICKEVGDGQG